MKAAAETAVVGFTRPPFTRLAPALLVGLAGALLLGLAARSLLDHQPFYDELLHVLAARGLLQTGHPAIGAGLYTRGQLYTWAVAISFQHFGDSLAVARLPALLAGLVLVAVMGSWMAYRAGLLAGAASVVILAIMPSTLELSVFARFYTMHALAICVLVIAVYEGYERRAEFKVLAGWVLLALIAAALAMHLQPPLTVIAFAGIGAALLALILFDYRSSLHGVVSRYRFYWMLGAVGALVLVLALGHVLGIFAMARDVPPWAAQSAADHSYYNRVLLSGLPFFWPLAPLLAIAAWFTPQRRLVLFCLVFAAVGLLVNSIAAWKSARYVYYLLPFLCAVLGCGLAALISRVAALLAQTDASGGRAAAVLAGVLLFVVVANSQEGHRAIKLAIGRPLPGDDALYAQEPDWRAVAPLLQRAAIASDRVITSNAMKALYYVGRYDYELNVSTLSETDTETDFGRDERTGRAVVGSAAAVNRILDQPGRTLVIAEDQKLDQPYGIPRETAAVIRARCAALALPAGAAVHAWQCGARAVPGPG